MSAPRTTAGQPAMPDPLDGRAEGPNGRPFTLPCACGAAVTVERLLLQLATAHGRPLAAERFACGLDPHTEGDIAHTTGRHR